MTILASHPAAEWSDGHSAQISGILLLSRALLLLHWAGLVAMGSGSIA